MSTENKPADVRELSPNEWAHLVINTITAYLGITTEEYFSKKDSGLIDPCDDLSIRMTLSLGGESAREELLEIISKWE